MGKKDQQKQIVVGTQGVQKSPQRGPANKIIVQKLNNGKRTLKKMGLDQPLGGTEESKESIEPVDANR